jgi:hypothetical protein
MAQQNPLRRQSGHPGKVANVLEREARGDGKARPVLLRRSARARAGSEDEEDSELISEEPDGEMNTAGRYEFVVRRTFVEFTDSDILAQQRLGMEVENGIVKNTVPGALADRAGVRSGDRTGIYRSMSGRARAGPTTPIRSFADLAQVCREAEKADVIISMQRKPIGVVERSGEAFREIRFETAGDAIKWLESQNAAVTDVLEWMWADAGTYLTRALARGNPLRWQKGSPAEVLVTLREEVLVVGNQVRPVRLRRSERRALELPGSSFTFSTLSEAVLWLTDADASVHLDNGAPVKLKWMWGDASIPYLTRALSYFNPLRWSGELSKAGLIHELQNQARSAPASQKRPVRVFRIGESAAEEAKDEDDKEDSEEDSAQRNSEETFDSFEKHVEREEYQWRPFSCPGEAAEWIRGTLNTVYEPAPLSAEINEVRLWHGTRGQNFESIVTGGFKLDQANYGLYGKGVYHADAICKSIQYADNEETPTVILSRVLLGRSYDLEPGDDFRRADAASFQSSGGQYESWRATPGKANSGDQIHKEYIVPDETQVYPEYVIELKKRSVLSTR